MRPNTPHVVFTPESSVCVGGHFYATSTIRDTCYGLMHGFVAGSLVTNADHTKAAFMMLTRMVAFYQQQFLPPFFAYDNDDTSKSGFFFLKPPH